MKKIMFNDRYGLTEAVLEKRKTMTRRVERIDFYPGNREEQIEKFCKRSATDANGRQVWLGFDNKGNWIAQLISHYAIGEEVAVAQRYWDLRNNDGFYEALQRADPSFPLECIKGEKGCHNKMFVRADWMPHQIEITDYRVERLQQISNDDCLKEGIIKRDDLIDSQMNNIVRYTFEGSFENHIYKTYKSPREAFAALIGKISGKKCWESNPWVLVYSFRLVK